jgi:AraC-like DNA-binding protein
MNKHVAPVSAVPMVRSSALMPFIGFAEGVGVPVERQLAEAKLPASIYAEPEALIPVKNAFQFVDRLARKEGIAHLGFMVGRQTQFQDLGAFGRLVLQSLTLHEALEKISRVINLYCSAQQIWIDSFANRARLNTMYSPRVGPGWQFGEQYTLTLLINCIRFTAGSTWRPEEIHLEETLYDLMYGKSEVLDGIPVRPSRVSGLVFDRKLLSTPLRPNQFAQDDAGDAEYHSLIATAPAADLPASISQLALISFADRQAQIGWIASAAGMSVRTLQRRLAEFGVDYSDLIDRVRFDHARNLLKDQTRNLIDIAYDLGYTDASSFTRAFRRWTGATPSNFRKLHISNSRDG